MAKVKDQYSQFMSFGITMSAANTLTYAQIGIGAALFDYAAFLVQRVEYNLARASYDELIASSDAAHVAIAGNSAVSDIYTTNNPAVYDRKSWFPIVSSTGWANMEHAPAVNDFSTYPGGGLLVPAQDIFVYMQTSGFAAAGAAIGRIVYRVIELQATEYIELVQRLRVLST